LVNVSVLAHVAEPAETLIVSLREALETQLDTLAKSGVLVHVGLNPVQAAHDGTANAPHKNINKRHRFSICPSPN
jgi:hypothetical protein